MNEQEKSKEIRRWKLWEFIGGFLSIFHFRPWRDLTMNRKILPRLDNEPPMIALDKLANEGLATEQKTFLHDPEIVHLMLDLMRVVCESDSSVDPIKTDRIERSLKNFLPVQTEPSEIENYVRYFHELDGSTLNAKNTCHILKVRGRKQVCLQVFSALYKLAYCRDIESEERRTVDRIGEWMGLELREIRQAAFAAKRKFDADTKASQQPPPAC